jgi:hypothetical protein
MVRILIATNVDSEKQFATAMARDVRISPWIPPRGVVKQMLKITPQTEISEIVRVSLSGHFTSEYVPEVEKALVQNGNKSKNRALDLLNVTFVDRPAMEFLRAAQSRKIKLENLPSYVKRWIQQEAGNVTTSFKPR